MDTRSVSTERWTPRQVFLATVVVAAIVLAFWLLYQVRWVFLLSFAAIVLATALAPGVRALRRLRLGPIPAAGAVHVAAIGLVALLGYIVGPVVVQQTAALLDALPQQYGELRSSLVASSNNLVGLIGRGLPETFGVWVNGNRPPEPLSDLATAWGFVVPLVGSLLAVLSVFLLSFYWTLEGDRAMRRVAMLLAERRRETARRVAEEVQAKLGAFVRGQAILCIAVGLMALVAYLWIGLPYAVALAVIAGVLEAIPILGPILGAVPAILVGFGLGWQTALWVVAAYVAIAQIESYLLVPRVMDRSVGVHPIVTLLAITSLFALLGPVGGVLAIPIAAILQLLLHRFVLARDANDRHIEEGHRDGASVLLYRTRELLDDLHAQQGERNHYPGDACPDRAVEVVQQVAHQLSGVLRTASGEGRLP